MFFFHLIYGLSVVYSSRTERESERKRGGGPRPVGKVKLPATKLCIKLFHWQLKLSPAYAHNAVLSVFLSPSLSPTFLLIPEVTAVFFFFQWFTFGCNHYIVAVYAYKQYNLSCKLSASSFYKSIQCLKKSCICLSLSVLLLSGWSGDNRNSLFNPVGRQRSL